MEQKELIPKTFGCNRLLYNYYLEDKKREYEQINQNQFMNVSKIFHHFYQKKKFKDLKIRKYKCPKCENELDRDENAAENILFEEIRKYMQEIE